MPRFKLTIAYDGTNYAGWQVQPGHATVQQAVEEAIAATVGAVVKLHGSGRTDRGVHARGEGFMTLPFLAYKGGAAAVAAWEEK